MEETLTKFMSESAKRHAENSNMIKEIRASTDVTVQNQGASIKTLEIQIGQEKGFGSLPSYTEANSRDHVKSISTTAEAIQTQYTVLDHPNMPKRRNRMDHNSRKLTLMKLYISINPYPEKRKTQGVSLYLAILIMFALIMPLLT
ncbi:hypothetical protein Tco_0977239 [Tanacetum coccineum]|uniref:Uncharacterized protein n=1 Tax=Tanacetum coccineum TaxID=301880 RepID=A0ABQ5EK09_9ASTR